MTDGDLKQQQQQQQQPVVPKTTPSLVAKRLSEITPATTKEIIDETKKYLDTYKLDLDGYRQVWKGIFFAMWASDKVPVQEKLAEELANLVFHVNKKKFEGVNLWFQACFSIMNKEWEKIDYWRVNKFSSLMRKILAGFIRYLRKKSFNTDYVRQFNKSIHTEFYLEITQTIGGLALHIMQIFPEVISHFKWASHEHICLLLDLFLKQLGPQSCKQLRQKVKEIIFQRIAEMKKNNNELENFNLNAYREKLFGLAKKKKTDDLARRDFYDIIEIFDNLVDMSEEEARYNTYIKSKEEKREQADKENEAPADESKKLKQKKQAQSPVEEVKEQKVAKKESKKEKKAAEAAVEPVDAKKKKNAAEVEESATVSSKKAKLNDASAKKVASEGEQPVAEKLSKKDKVQKKKQEKLEKLIQEEEARLEAEAKAKAKKGGKKVEVVEEEGDDDDDEEGDQDWEDQDLEDGDEDEGDDDDDEGDDLEGDEEDDDDDDFEDEDEDDEEEIDEEELNMLLKGTGSCLEVDDVDEDFFEDDDFEGYNVSDVIGTPARMNGLQKVYNSMPKYHFLSEPQKHKYFNNVTTRFKTNLNKENIKGCSHQKKVVFNKNGNKTKEFDLNEEVIALEKTPVIITKMKQVKVI